MGLSCMKKVRHIVIAIPCLNRGGTEMQTLCLVKALVFSGFRVTVLCYFEYDRAVVDEYRVEGCKVMLMNMDRSISRMALIVRLRSVFIDLKPDVIHVQYMTPGALAVIAARLSGVHQVFATVHQPYSSWHSPVWKILLRSSAFLCDHFISVSQKAESSWFGTSHNFTDYERIALPKHFTIHNAVDIDLVETLTQSEEAMALKKKICESGHFIFGYIGRLSYEKGVDILFDAFDILAQQYKSIDLVIVGDGPEMATLRDRYSSKVWWGNVRFVGKQSWKNAIQYLSVMDAVVVPSRFEGFGLSAVESMAASKPVIASDAGGLGEVIENNRSGLLFRNENVVDLASAMVMLLKYPEDCLRLACNAKRRSNMFDVKRFNENIHDLYNKRGGYE